MGAPLMASIILIEYLLLVKTDESEVLEIREENMCIFLSKSSQYIIKGVKKFLLPHQQLVLYVIARRLYTLSYI